MECTEWTSPWRRFNGRRFRIKKLGPVAPAGRQPTVASREPRAFLYGAFSPEVLSWLGRVQSEDWSKAGESAKINNGTQVRRSPLEPKNQCG